MGMIEQIVIIKNVAEKKKQKKEKNKPRQKYANMHSNDETHSKPIQSNGTKEITNKTILKWT